MGANRSGQRRKLHMKRSIRNWKTSEHIKARKNTITVRGAILKTASHDGEGEKAGAKRVNRH